MKHTLLLWVSAGLAFGYQAGPAQTFARAERTVQHSEYAPLTHRSLREVLKQVKSEYGVHILFENRTVDHLSVPAGSIRMTAPVEVVLENLLRPFGLTFRKIKDRSYIIVGEAKNPRTIAGLPRPALVTLPSIASDAPTGTPSVTTIQLSPKDVPIRGTVKDGTTGEPLPGANLQVKGTTRGATTDGTGSFRIDVPDREAVLIVSSVGFETREILVGSQSILEINLKQIDKALNEVVVVGYGEQKRESITGAISSISSKDLDKIHGGATVSSGLAGKIPGVSFRMTDGRPGASANIQIRNMGNPLYVIDGIQKDAGQFNNISPNDIESITVLKDASAAIYGVRAANGVIVVKTKRGRTGSQNTINVDAYTGFQNWTRFPRTTNAYEWMLGKADAEMNQYGRTDITPAELAKWKQGTEYGYRSFDWYDFIVKKNSPQYNVNLSATGGSDKINYYISATHLFQNSVLGREFIFKRTNIQSNVDAQITNSLKVGVQINGRIETRDNPGVPGVDDYWAPRFALFRNRPTERPFANDNPNYLNDIGHNDTNWGLLNKKKSGYWTEDWRVLQANFTGEYTFPVKGLTARGVYSYYIADRLMNGHEYTYDAFTYYPDTQEYKRTGGSTNPWRERGTRKVLENVLQGQLNYNNTFGKHGIGATFVAERISRREIDVWVHSVPQTNELPLLQFADMDTYNDTDVQTARAGYIGRFNYNYDNKYFLELAGRRDASYKFAPSKRWGFFPSVSAGWRITEEPFAREILGAGTILTNLKLRGSYGALGDDDVGIGDFDYVSGYSYGSSTVVMDGQVIKGSRDRGVPITNITWFTSKILDIGADFSLLNGKVNGSVDYFNRRRSGLRGRKYDVLVPSELGYSLPDENVNSDSQIGGEGSLSYTGKAHDVTYSIGGNLSFSRRKFLSSYKPRWNNSLDHYRNSGEQRWNDVFWGYHVTGQFQSQQQINEYGVNVDGQGNKTLLPGDLIYEDTNKDGVIDDRDVRPIGNAVGNNPTLNYGLNFQLAWKGIDFTADFSGGAGYSYMRNWEMRWAYQNGGALLRDFYDDRWHREDPFNLNSPWIAGKYPALRFNDGGHSNNNKDSDFWLTNVRYLRLRTLEIGYSLPKTLLERVKVKRARIYFNTYNLFSIDNLRKVGIDPEISEGNGLAYPQNKFVNVGVNLSL